jgi:hypothetical protein
MGEKTTALEREIRDHRQRIEHKVDALEERLRGDAADASSTFADELVSKMHLRDHAEQRPMTTLLGAFGAGVMLGITSDRKGSRRRNGNGQKAREGGLLDMLVGGTSGALSGGLGRELQTMLREFLGSDDDRDRDVYAEPSPARRNQSAAQP